MITAINMYDCTCHSSAAQIYVPWPHLRTSGPTHLSPTYVLLAPPTLAQPMYFWPLPPWPNLCTSGHTHLGLTITYVLLTPPTYKTLSSVRALYNETNEEEVHGIRKEISCTCSNHLYVTASTIHLCVTAHQC